MFGPGDFDSKLSSDWKCGKSKSDLISKISPIRSMGLVYLPTNLP